MISPFNLLGTGTAIGTQGITNQTQQAALNPDNTTNWAGFGGALGGAGLGGLLGGITGNRVSAKSVEELKKLLKKGPNIKQAVEAKTGLKEGLLKSRTGVTKWLAENPKLATGGGALLGALLGSQLIGKALSGGSQAETAQQLQNYQAQDAQRQRNDLLTLQSGSNIRFT